MKAIRIFSAIVLSGLLMAGAGCTKSGDTSKSIDGKWDGSDLANPGAQCELTVGNGKFEFRGTDEDDSFSGTIATFYAEQQPGSIDIKITAPPEKAGKVALLIFEHNDNELKLAWAPLGTRRRPVNFTPAPDVRVVSFKRQ